MGDTGRGFMVMAGQGAMVTHMQSSLCSSGSGVRCVHGDFAQGVGCGGVAGSRMSSVLFRTACSLSSPLAMANLDGSGKSGKRRGARPQVQVRQRESVVADVKAEAVLEKEKSDGAAKREGSQGGQSMEVDGVTEAESKEDRFRSMRRTKLICTIGPATCAPDQLEALAMGGMHVARFNMSHGLNSERGYSVAIMMDTEGNKIHMGDFTGAASVKAEKGSVVTRSLVQCPLPRFLSSSVAQAAGSPSALLKEQEDVVSSGMEEIEKKLDLLLSVQTKLEESVTPPTRQKQESCERDNFYVNCGAAIRNLREELPALFYKDLNYDIYREDITFSDPMNTFAGLQNYKTLFWALRFHGRIFFKALWVDIVRVWQPSDKVIMVRWIVRGVPRVPWEAQGRFEGNSEYKLDKDGKIYAHKADNIIMNLPPKFQTRSVMDLVRAAAGQGTPTPTYYQKVGVLAFLQQFTWIRFYLALRSTLALTSMTDTCDILPSASLNP